MCFNSQPSSSDKPQVWIFIKGKNGNALPKAAVTLKKKKQVFFHATFFCLMFYGKIDMKKAAVTLKE